ncbi:hypothetical protein TWF694_001479 [Orbilia ellipsospora]|uniref:Uncharacterized protein n=1 Tax=Orbilia ellipsospora TaxID=2528407 RepID=A0AAV9XT65_9PEZI
MSQKPIVRPPPPAGILKSPVRPSSSSTGHSHCEKCSIHTKSTTINVNPKEGESEHSNLAACGEWLACICGTLHFVICWSCTLSGEVKSHSDGRRGSAATRSERMGSTGSCTCGKNTR